MLKEQKGLSKGRVNPFSLFFLEQIKMDKNGQKATEII